MKNGTAPDQKWLKPDLTIFIGLREISGYYTNLSRGLRDLGYRVIFVGGELHPFRYGSDAERAALPLIPRVYENLLIARRDVKKLRRLQLPVLNTLIEIWQIIMFIWSLFICDVYIFGYAHSFIKGGYDLAILKWLSKRVIVNMGHGSESRPPYIDGSLRRSDGSWGKLTHLRKQAKFIARRAIRIERYASLVVASPLTSQFLTLPAICFFAIGQPVKPPTSSTGSSPKQRDSVKIFHAPSKPIAKGSVEIKKVVTALALEGLNIDFVEVTNRPNADVLAQLQQCDVVVDQLYSDSTMTGIAYEAAELAKPTIVSGYGFHDVAIYSKAMAAPPTLKCTPETFENTLRFYIENQLARIEAGQKAQDFVRSHWSQKSVAAKYKKLISASIEPEWIFNPRDIQYIFGCALKTSDLKNILDQYISKFSVIGLELGHRPDLEEKLFQMANPHHNPAHSTSVGRPNVRSII